MTFKLTYDEALLGLQRAVEEKGADYVYPNAYQPGDPSGASGCVYFDWENQTQPSCIVGHVLHYKGITIDDIDNQASIDSQYEYINMDEKTHHLLLEVQNKQDDGVPWGKALEVALGKVHARAD